MSEASLYSFLMSEVLYERGTFMGGWRFVLRGWRCVMCNVPPVLFSYERGFPVLFSYERGTFMVVRVGVFI